MTEVTVHTDRIRKVIPNFFNNIHFHPTDAIEDNWGKNILRELHRDNAVRIIRIYTMFEDMVTMGQNGELIYDFTSGDRRMDILIKYGFRLIVTFCFMPVCMSSRPDTRIEKNRYKGKGYNSYEPADYMQWQNLCRIYTRHLVDRYGLDTVCDWYLECWNEPDAQYWMKDEEPDIKITSYVNLYSHFVKGVTAVSNRLKTGGPAACGGLPQSLEIVEALIKSIPTGNKVDFISYHTYSISPQELDDCRNPDLMLNIAKIKAVHRILLKYGNGDIPIIIDEWESVWGGYTGTAAISRMSYRNSNYFAAAYAKMIDLCINELIMENVPLKMIMLCLSGQHDLKKDFQGTRNFLTLSGYKKPIYNAYVLTNKLGNELLDYEITNNRNLGIIPTDGNGLKLLIYTFNEDIDDKSYDMKVKIKIHGIEKNFSYDIYKIDSKNSNSYSQWKETPDDLPAINEASHLKASKEKAEGNSIRLTLEKNSVCLIEIKGYTKS